MAVKEIGEELFSDLEVRRPDLEISVVETPLFGRLWAPESLDEYMALAQCGTLADQPLSGWRGQSDASWPLHSAAYRRLNNQPQGWLLDDAESAERALREYDDGLLQQARPAGHGYRDGRRLDDL